MITQGDMVRITKGNRKFRIAKGERFKVVAVRENGKEYGHSVSITLDAFSLGPSAPKTFLVRYVSFLAKEEVTAHKGDPTQTIRLRKSP